MVPKRSWQYALLALFLFSAYLFSQVVRPSHGGAGGDIDALPFLDLTTAHLPEKGSLEARHASIYNHVGSSYIGAKSDAEVPSRIGRYQYGGDYDSLPTSDADLIIVGTVTGEAPQISSNGTSIYSHIFILPIEEIKGHALSQQGHIKAERQGGVVKLPSGKKRYEGIVGQGLPVPGTTYLLFLKYQDGTYYIINGYTYDSGSPKALDERDDHVQAKGGADLVSQVIAKLGKS